MLTFIFQVSTVEIPSLLSNQEETDTRVILYINYAKAQGFKSVVVRTPDTDIFFILLYHAHNIQMKIYVDIGVGKKRKLINVSELASELGREWCTVLLCFYVFTGEDCTSAFKGKGKVAPLKKLMKTPKFHRAFRLDIEYKHQNSRMRCRMIYNNLYFSIYFAYYLFPLYMKFSDMLRNTYLNTCE